MEWYINFIYKHWTITKGIAKLINRRNKDSALKSWNQCWSEQWMLFFPLLLFPCHMLLFPCSKLSFPSHFVPFDSVRHALTTCSSGSSELHRAKGHRQSRSLRIMESLWLQWCPVATGWHCCVLSKKKKKNILIEGPGNEFGNERTEREQKFSGPVIPQDHGLVAATGDRATCKRCSKHPLYGQPRQTQLHKNSNKNMKRHIPESNTLTLELEFIYLQYIKQFLLG